MANAAGYFEKEGVARNAYDHIILFTWKDMTDDSPEQEKMWRSILADATPSFDYKSMEAKGIEKIHTIGLGLVNEDSQFHFLCKADTDGDGNVS